MNKNINYYKILEVGKNATNKEIKKAYHKLSFRYHPDQNKEIDSSKFKLLNESYNILIDDNKRLEYDKKSKFGRYYTNKFKFKKSYNDIEIKIEKNHFNGSLEYERWVKCKKCEGNGKDLYSKIYVKDNLGNIKVFDGEYGCDFCDGTGKYNELDCKFCDGKGRVGLNICSSCNGEKRILGIQKLKNIKLTSNKTRIDSMGHFSKDGKVGSLIIIY